ncbi:MAG TPA: hypothetical protein VNT30_17725 [Stellaceae bacterium]|nr:hypothetical protein [Stellaceae bacterium]
MLSATVGAYAAEGSTPRRIYHVTCEDEAGGLEMVAGHPSLDPAWRLRVEWTRRVKDYASPRVEDWTDI